MSWGKLNRINRIFAADGKTVMFAVDHPYFQGSITGLRDMKYIFDKVAPFADALMPSVEFAAYNHKKGFALDPKYDKPIVLRVSGGTSVHRKQFEDEDVTLSVEEAIRLGATAIAISVFVGTEFERRSIKNLGDLVSEADRYGIPVLAVTAVGGKLDESAENAVGKNFRYLSLASRICQATGASFVKTYYCDNDSEGNTFEHLVKSMHVPVVVAGGKRPDNLKDMTPEYYALDMAYKAIQSGAAGVDMGRNIFQSERPEAMIDAISKVVHENYPPLMAHEFYENQVAVSKKK